MTHSLRRPAVVLACSMLARSALVFLSWKLHRQKVVDHGGQIVSNELNDALSRERFASTGQAARQSKRKELVAPKPRIAVQPSTARQVVAAAARGIARRASATKPRRPASLLGLVSAYRPVDQAVVTVNGPVALLSA